MDRRLFFSRAVMAAGAGAGMGLLGACSAPAGTSGVIVAIPLTAKPGKSAADVLSAMRPIIEFIRSQKGLLEEELLGTAFPNNNPTHIHIMRWKELKDWENLSGDPKFLSAVDNAGDAFSLQLAQVFTEVKV